MSKAKRQDQFTEGMLIHLPPETFTRLTVVAKKKTKLTGEYISRKRLVEDLLVKLTKKL